MSNNKQSSIEWLEHTVKSISVGRASTSRYKEMILELIRQAKAMHKDEIINAQEHIFTSAVD